MRLVLSAAFAVFAAAASSPAFAHAHLVSEAPAAGSSVNAPTQLTLTFSEAIELKLSGIVATGPAGPLRTGAARLDGETILIAPLDAPLAPGKYHVEWHALARDGHRTTGAYDFTITP